MGIIKRQGIKHSIVRYFGIALGALNIILLFPLFLGDEKLGLITFIVQTAFLIHAFSLMGIGSVVIKFFPEFKNDDNYHNGLLSFALIWALVGFVIFLIGVLIFRPWIISFYGQKSSEYLQYLPLVIPLTFAISFFNLLKFYVYNFNRIVIPALFEQLYKLIVPILAGLHYFELITFKWLMYGVLSYYFISFLGMLIYLHKLGQLKVAFDFTFFNKTLLKKIKNYAGYAILGSVGSMLALRIDTLMVASMIDLSSNGIYAVALFIASVIKVPGESVRSISGPIITANIADNNLLEVSNIYKKSSIVLWTIGLFLLLLIWLNLDSLFQIMPKGEIFAKGKYVVLILGAGILFDLLTSVNGEIINYSPYYRFNFYALLCLAVINIIANLLLIPEYKIIGAASATACSLTLFNVIKLVFIYLKYNMHPFSNKTIFVLLITLLIYGLLIFTVNISNPFLSVVIRSSLAILLFLPTVFYFNISEDLNNMVLDFWNKGRSFF